MAVLQFNYATFVQGYEQFADDVAFPQATLQFCWNDATTIMSNNTACGGLTVAQRNAALNLLTAHLAVLNSNAAAGNLAGLVTGASIDKINVTVTPPPDVNQWQNWLQQTQYGMQLLSRLQIWSVGGFFVGGYPTTFTMPR